MRVLIAILSVMILVACGSQEVQQEVPQEAELEIQQEPTQEPTQEPEEEPTQEPQEEPTQEPTQEPQEEVTQEPEQTLQETIEIIYLRWTSEEKEAVWDRLLDSLVEREPRIAPARSAIEDNLEGVDLSWTFSIESSEDPEIDALVIATAAVDLEFEATFLKGRVKFDLPFTLSIGDGRVLSWEATVEDLAIHEFRIGF